MIISDILLSRGGELDTEQKRINLSHFQADFYLSQEELKNAFFDLKTEKLFGLSFDYKKAMEAFLTEESKKERLTDKLTKKQKEKLNNYIDKKHFNLICVALSRKFKLSPIQSKKFLQEMILHLLVKTDIKDELKMYNVIFQVIIRNCNKYDDLDEVQTEILATKDSELKELFEKAK